MWAPASAGLGGGCFHGDSCGAVTGAAMALSIVFGFDRPNAEEADKPLIEKVHEFQKRFLRRTAVVSAASCSAVTTRLIPMPLPDDVLAITAHAISVGLLILDSLTATVTSDKS